jgi:hypothetical protein
MDKIFNSPKINIYGNDGMINKYIYMKREDDNKYMYFIYNITDISNRSFPITYKCERAYVLNIFKNRLTNANVYDNIEYIKLDVNDVLYQINPQEYLAIFRLFVECEGTKCKALPNPIL